MGSYQAALSAPGINIYLTHATRHTSGVGFNIEQEITKNIGVFSRLGWNDGHNEAWMFTDVNPTGSVGVSIKGESLASPRRYDRRGRRGKRHIEGQPEVPGCRRHGHP
jgi:high affinity Mn2+ porin